MTGFISIVDYFKSRNIMKSLCIITLLVLQITGCTNKNDDSVVPDTTVTPLQNNTSFISDDKQIDAEEQLKNLKWLSTSLTYQEFADELINGKLCIGNYVKERPDYNPESIMDIDWNMQVGDLPNTYQLYLQALSPVYYLSVAFNLTEQKEYMDLAYMFVESWEKYEKFTDLSSDNVYVWDSHGMAMRAEYLLYFALTGIKENYFTEDQYSKINELLLLHVEKLSDMENYHKNHNHGVAQDRALIALSYYFSNEYSGSWIDLAKERLQGQWDFEFTAEMVSTENSFDYQIFNKNLYSYIIDFLDANGDEWGKEKKLLLIQCDDVTGWMIKPNNMSSLHGESGYTVYTEASGAENSVLRYVTSGGISGNIPDSNYVLYDEAGYYIFREYWPNASSDTQQLNSQDSMWLMFKSGFLSNVHKQDDDNTFQLYAKGHDIFVDPGFYGYVSNDLRIYLTSASGHNAVSVDDKTYYAKNTEPGDAGIVFSEFGNDYGYVVGKNDYYSEVQLMRHITNLSETIFLYDECLSENEHVYTQNFQCGPDIEVASIKDDEILLLINDTDYRVRIRQLDHNTTVEVLMGSEDTPYGQYSPYVGEVEYINTIRFTVTGTNVNFATLISIEDLDGNSVDFSEYIWDSQKNIINFLKPDSDKVSIGLKSFDGETMQ